MQIFCLFCSDLATILTALIAGGWYIYLRNKNKKNDQINLDKFGDNNNYVQGQEEFKNLLVKRYISQQNWSFGLAWFSVAMSLVLGAMLIFKISNGEFNVKILTEAIGLASGVIISVSAFRLYKITSEKIEKILS